MVRNFSGCDLFFCIVARNILRTRDLVTTTLGSSVPGFCNVRFVEVWVETVASISFGAALQSQGFATISFRLRPLPVLTLNCFVEFSGIQHSP